MLRYPSLDCVPKNKVDRISPGMDISSPPAWSTSKKGCDQSYRRRSGYKLQLHPVSIYINKKLDLAKDSVLRCSTFVLVVCAVGPEVLDQLAKADFPDPDRS